MTPRSDAAAGAAADADSVPAYPFARTSALDPSPEYDRLRAQCPVAPVIAPSGDKVLLVTGYEEVRAVLSDPRFSREATLEPGAPRLAAPPQRFKSLLNLDPPEHARVRRLVSREFTPRRVALLRPRIRERAEALLDEMVRKGPPTDLVRAYSLPLPLSVICELLGVPYEDWTVFTEWSSALLATTGPAPERVAAGLASLRGYMSGLVAAKRAAPGDDLLSALVQSRDQDDGSLDEEELVYLGISLLMAGHETTANQLSNSVFALLTRHRALAADLCDPERAPRAVDELLRLYMPGDEALLRIALEDVRLGGTVVPAGSGVLPSVAAANRDRLQFDAPAECDPDRPSNPHLAFGHGIHFCLGAGLARAEVEIALGALLRRLPDLRLAVEPESVRRTAGLLVTGVEALPIAW
ncbi:MAG TPA: cytochrome P450 [Actinocrinis sp.]|nr:cytochrome P450 [Actinocrinis sp.]